MLVPKPEYTTARAVVNVFLNICTTGLWSFWAEYRNHKIYG